MARTTRAAANTIPVTVNIVDQLVTKLNTISGIEFVRDAWVNKAPENYGVVELRDTPRQLWADGHLLDTVWTVVITLYVAGDDDTYPAQVQTKLEEMEDANEVELTHTISRSFDYEIGKVAWVWQVSMTGPLTREVS